MKKSSSIIRNAFTVGALTALSRVLGLVREMLQSRLIGAGVAQSAFTLAFAIPNMARKLFGEGALTAAFVPVFKGAVETESKERAAQLARAVMTTVLLMLGATVVLAFCGLETVVKFREELGITDNKRFLLTVRLVKTLLPYMLFICGAAFGMGVLNALGKFWQSSFMPCLLNIVWILILVWIFFFPELRPDQRIHRVAMAILFAGALQFAFMLCAMRSAGVTPGITFSGWRDSAVIKVWKNLGVAALGAGAIQLNYMLDQILAQLASPWAAGVIGYAERLMDLPLGVIGVAFGTVLLPSFAGLFAKNDIDGARKAMGDSVNSLLFVMIPAAVGLGVLAHEVTGVIYEGGEFDAVATSRVGRALAVYAVGLGFFGFQKILVPWFQGQNDMKTPLKVSLATVSLNAVLNILAVSLLPVEWRHVGLAASTVFCSFVGCAMLLAMARLKNGQLGLVRCLGPLWRILAASSAMAAALLAARRFVRISPLADLAVLIALGAAVYFAVAVPLTRGRVSLRRRR